MRLVNAFFLTALLFAISARIVDAWDWPVSSPEVVVGFAAVQDELPTSGVYLTGSDQTVRAVADGQIIYQITSERCQWCLPSVLGAATVLEHADGFRTLSGHLDGLVTGIEPLVGQGESLGIIGQSGAAVGRRLFFQVYDLVRDVYVNPFLLLPSRTDATPPRILDIELVSDPTGTEANRYRVLATVVDRQLGEAVPPYATELLIGGQLRNTVTFDVLRANLGSGRLETGAGSVLENVLSPGSTLYLGTYVITPGVSQVEIVIRDFYGNTAQETMILSAP